MINKETGRPKFLLPKAFQNSSGFHRTLWLDDESQDSFWNKSSSDDNKDERASQMSGNDKNVTFKDGEQG